MAGPTTVQKLIEIVDKTANAEETLLFIKGRDRGIQHPQPLLDDVSSKNKCKKKNLKGGKGKKTKTDKVLAGLPNKRHFSSICHQER